MDDGKRYQLQTKIITTFVVLAAILLALGLVEIISMVRVKREADRLKARVLPKLQTIDSITRNIGLEESAILQHVISTQPEEMTAFEQRVRGLMDANSNHFTLIRNWLDSDEERRLYQVVMAKRQEDHSHRRALMAQSQADKASPQLSTSLKEHYNAYGNYQQAVAAFAEQIQKDAQDQWAATIRTIQFFSLLGKTLIGIGLLIGVIMSVVIARVARDLAESNRQFEFEIAERRRAEEAVVGAIEGEQRRIARDLHDGLVQHLSGIFYLGEALRANLATTGPEDATRAGRITELLRQAIEQSRGLARGLYPMGLETRGLPSALRELADTVQQTWGVQCVLDCSGFPLDRDEIPIAEINLEAATNLFRIAQEATNNAIRHADPDQIRIELARGNGVVLLQVTDDGKGIPEQLPAENHGMGLRSMKYRASMMGASLSIQMAPGGGTSVACRLPIL